MSDIDEKLHKTSPRLLALMMSMADGRQKENHRWTCFSERRETCSTQFAPGRWRKQWTGKSLGRIDPWE